jgi:hypothetical protein
MHLFHFSTFFKQPRAHHQEKQLYQYNICYVSFCVSDLLVCRSELHTRRLPKQSDIYQMYWYNLFSWWWARGCSEHIENWNKYKRIVRQVGYLQVLYEDSRSAKHKKYVYMLLTFLTINSYLALNNTNILLLMICTDCVFCEMGTESVHALEIRIHRFSPSSQPSRTGRLYFLRSSTNAKLDLKFQSATLCYICSPLNLISLKLIPLD